MKDYDSLLQFFDTVFEKVDKYLALESESIKSGCSVCLSFFPYLYYHEGSRRTYDDYIYTVNLGDVEAHLCRLDESIKIPEQLFLTTTETARPANLHCENHRTFM